ncbi:MAG: hypothetical protein H0W06_07860 [Chloroflexia bacterium]|nr:hypothetical protein [Chloroflexia bacterium]
MAMQLTAEQAQERRLRRLEEQRRVDADGRVAVWGFVWTLFAFKMATVALILWAARDQYSVALILSTTWFWLFIPAVAVSGPLLYRQRLRRVRRRRQALRRAEWLLDAPGEPDAVGQHTSGERAGPERDETMMR